MIGELIVSILNEETGLSLTLGEEYRAGGGSDPIVGLNLADSAIIAAIRQRDGRIFDALEGIIDQAHLALDLPSIQHAMGLGWDYHMRGGTEYRENYIKQLNRLIDNPFAREDDKERARYQLREIKKAIERPKIKQQLMRRRRSEFQSKQDQLMLALIERDGYECTKCGEVEGLTIDHVIPLSKGGSDDLDNLQLLCKQHNSSKGDSMP